MLCNVRISFVYAAIASCFVLVGSSRAFAQDPERAELENRINLLSEEAAELREIGRRDEAAQRLQEVEELRRHLADRRRESVDGPHARYLKQIFAAVDALRELGRPEDARRLLEIGQQLQREAGRPDGERDGPVVRRRIIRRVRENGEVREEHEERVERGERREREEHEEHVERGDRDREEHEERRARDERRERQVGREREPREERGEPRRDDRERPGRERDREREEHPELQAARRQAAVLRMAMSAPAAADREEEANQLEQAIHALELAIEGRRDEEARRVRQAAPNRRQQAELLMLAQRILRDSGMEDRAQAVGQLARRFSGSERPARGNEQSQELRRVQERIRELTSQLEELRHHVERLHRD